MPIELVKLKIVEWVIKQEKTVVLEQLLGFIENFDERSAQQEKIIGHKANGNRVTHSQFVAHLVTLSEQPRKKMIPLDEAEQQSENW